MAVTLASGALLAACAGTPPRLPEPPEVVLPAHFEHAADSGIGASDSAADSPDVDPTVLAGWWELLGSSELDALVDRALANNPDLRVANYQVQEAAIRRDGTVIAGQPEIGLPITMAAQYPNGQVPGVPSPSGSGGVQMSLQSNLQASWRPDVWGEQQANRESAALQLARAVHQREDVQRSLVAMLVGSYIDYLAAEDAVGSTREQLQLCDRLLANAQLALDAHDAVLEDVERNRAALAAVQVTLPTLEQQRDQAANLIAYLVGATAGDLRLSGSGLDTLALPDPALTLNTRLLLERPDVRMMESRMLAARADLAAAHARLLPAVNFSAASGFAGMGLAHLLSSQLFFWNAVASVTPVIFDGGRRANEAAGNRAIYEEMVGTYLRTLLMASREVEDALGAVRSNRARLEAQQVSEQATRRILALNREAYRSGAVSTAIVLEAQRAWQQAHADQLHHRGEFLKSYVSLFQSLGAGGARDALGATRQAALALDAPRFGDPLPVKVAADAWRVELPGIYPGTVVPSVWRDLQARFNGRPDGLGLRADLSGETEAAASASGHWFRLSLVNFDDRAAALRFCDELKRQQQLCSAVHSQGKAS